ncbi:MAG: hypothetical protein ACO3JF_07665 [Ilumatobacteraceae bacterium]
MNSATLGIEALHDMRAERRRHRVADMEWFEALYRVYLAALLGGGAIMYLSDIVTDKPLSGSQLTDLYVHTPHVVGCIAALAFFIGVRSGANGGPLAVEEAEVRHVLMAPIDRGGVLRHPAIQRIRTFMFAGAIAGGVANQLLGRRIPSASAGLPTFAMWGALAGSIIGAVFVVSALLTHGLSLPRWSATTVGSILLAWQVAVTGTSSNVSGPFDFIGSIAMWWHHWQPLDLIGVAVVALLTITAMSLTRRLSLEALARRSSLVSQMKFAVTLQDIRTVVLLRRQLSQEYMRVQPWWKIPSFLRRDVVVGRGLRSMMHFPVRRLFRMMLLAAAAGAALVVAWHGTTPAIVLSGLCLFILGLDVVEPLSQEVDQPDRTDALPVERGLLMAKHLIVPSVVVLPFIVVGVAMAFVLEPHVSTIGYGFLLGVPAALGGVAGAAINAVKGAPDPVGGATESLALPAEVSGMGTVIRAIWPPVVSIVCSAPVLAVRLAHENNTDVTGTAFRASGAVAIVLALVAGWVRQRDHIHAWFRNAKTATAPQKISEGS